MNFACHKINMLSIYHRILKVMSSREYNIMKSGPFHFFIIIQKNPPIFFPLQKHNQVNLEKFVIINLIIVKKTYTFANIT